MYAVLYDARNGPRAIEAMTRSRDLGYNPAEDMLKYWGSGEFKHHESGS